MSYYSGEHLGCQVLEKMSVLELFGDEVQLSWIYTSNLFQSHLWLVFSIILSFIREDGQYYFIFLNR